MLEMTLESNSNHSFPEFLMSCHQKLSDFFMFYYPLISIRIENRTFYGQKPGSFQRWSKGIVGISTRNNVALRLRKKAVCLGQRSLELLLKSVLHYVFTCINIPGHWPSIRLKIHRYFVFSFRWPSTIADINRAVGPESKSLFQQ